ncbi:DUF4314 domain-containing protein [Micromonospora musae]|uniref:DUF4314 domain-containing protein n=1 Tax=Micromonospora musae TaxID=1894970 RepID=UPI0033EE6C2B
MTTRTPDAIPGDRNPPMTYRPAGRVALEHTTDPHTLLRPGDEGTVRRYDPQTRVLDVAWDNGSRLSLLLGESDRVRPIAGPGPDREWERVLDALRSAGETAGRDAANQWAQHILGGQARGDAAATARQVLTGIDDIDPPILDGLPTADRNLLADDADRYADYAPPDAPAWETLTGGSVTRRGGRGATATTPPRTPKRPAAAGWSCTPTVTAGTCATSIRNGYEWAGRACSRVTGRGRRTTPGTCGSRSGLSAR